MTKLELLKKLKQRINDTENTFWGSWLNKEDFNESDYDFIEDCYEKINANLCKMYHRLDKIEEKEKKQWIKEL